MVSTTSAAHNVQKQLDTPVCCSLHQQHEGLVLSSNVTRSQKTASTSSLDMLYAASGELTGTALHQSVLA
eukprot:11447-Heterococcus_DN1.PRE.3